MKRNTYPNECVGPKDGGCDDQAVVEQQEEDNGSHDSGTDHDWNLGTVVAQLSIALQQHSLETISEHSSQAETQKDNAHNRPSA